MGSESSGRTVTRFTLLLGVLSLVELEILDRVEGALIHAGTISGRTTTVTHVNVLVVFIKNKNKEIGMFRDVLRSRQSRGHYRPNY